MDLVALCIVIGPDARARVDIGEGADSTQNHSQRTSCSTCAALGRTGYLLWFILCAGPSRPVMAQQASGSFRRREAERLRRFIAARQLSVSHRANGEGPLDPNNPIRAAEEADPLAEQPNQEGTCEGLQQKQVCSALQSEILNWDSRFGAAAGKTSRQPVVCSCSTAQPLSL